MRKIICSIAVIILLISIIGCAKAPTWQEQYDLGLRYLSEGNYEEAIIAFTVAIEIDAKQAPAYIGRGDAYVGQAASPVARGADDNYNSAVTDYLAAIDLHPLAAEVYEKLGRVYIEQGDFDAAADILERGYEATKDEKLSELLDMLRIEINGPAAAVMESLERMRTKLEEPTAAALEEPVKVMGPVTVRGRVIDNIDEYSAKWEEYLGQYGKDRPDVSVCITSFGIIFDSPQEVVTENGIEYVVEAAASAAYETLESLAGHTVELTGSLYFTGEKEFAGPYAPGTRFEDEYIHYLYNPNGPWRFFVESYKIVN